MPFDGNGNFIPLTAPIYPAVAGQTIIAARFNAVIDDLMNNGLSRVLTRDGQSAMTGNLPMGGFQVTGMADPGSAQAAATKAYVDGEVEDLGIRSAAQYGAVPDGITPASISLNAFFAALASSGGVGIIPPGVYLLDAQVTFTKASFDKRITVFAAGAVFKPTHSGSGLRITGGGAAGGGLTVYDLQIDVVGNTTTTVGFDIFGATFTNLVRCIVEYQTAHANFTPFLVQNSDPADENTGSYWSKLSGCVLRQVSGDPANYVPQAIKLLSQQNAVTIENCTIGTCKTGILVTYAPTRTSSSNGVVIDNNYFEGLERAVVYDLSATGVPDGLVLTNNRVELCTIEFLKITGATASNVPQPPFLAGNHFATATCPKYMNVPADMPYTSLDTQYFAVTDSAGMGVITNRNAVDIRANFNDDHALTVTPQGIGYGMTLRRFDGGTPTTVGKWVVRASSGSVFGGDDVGDKAYGTLIAGISSGTTEARNLCGTVTLAAGTATVTFPVAETDASYRISLSGNAAETFSWASKLPGSFVINSSNASSVATVDWHIFRNN